MRKTCSGRRNQSRLLMKLSSRNRQTVATVASPLLSRGRLLFVPQHGVDKYYQLLVLPIHIDPLDLPSLMRSQNCEPPSAAFAYIFAVALQLPACRRGSRPTSPSTRVCGGSCRILFAPAVFLDHHLPNRSFIAIPQVSACRSPPRDAAPRCFRSLSRTTGFPVPSPGCRPSSRRPLAERLGGQAPTLDRAPYGRLIVPHCSDECLAP